MLDSSSKKFYFISGLPRSGSTLLSALLKQNPNFYSDIASPVDGLMLSAIQQLSQAESTTSITEQQRASVVLGIINGFYSARPESVIFDSSRGWTASTHLLLRLFPYTKIICCVRDIVWVLDSFEKIANKNPLYGNTLSDQETSHCVSTRADGHMDVKKDGAVIKPLHWLQQGMRANPSMIMLVEYDALTRSPARTLKRVYHFIDQPFYENHNFNNVQYENPNFDLHIGVPNLHTVNGPVKYTPRNLVLPDKVVQQYSGLEFWRDSFQGPEYS